MVDYTDPDDIPAVSAALVTAIGEAQARLQFGVLGEEFFDLLRHARELHVLLLELLLTAEPKVDERTRGLADSIGNNLDTLDAALRPDVAGSPT